VKKLALTIILGASVCAFGETWSGTISESGCGAKHAAGTEKDAACIKKCVEKGAAPVLVVDGKVMKLSDDSKTKVMDHLGHKVTVTGKLEGDAISVDSVKM
jgi:hypothetical protein